MANSSLCPLCHQEDGGPHIASGCQCTAMNGMYTERHNRGGRIILTGIYKGNLGGRIVSADVGTKEKCEEDKAPHIIATNPTVTLPPKQGCTEEEHSQHQASMRKLRPDIVLATADTGTPSDRTIHIVEVKFCKDTDHKHQLESSLNQHKTLVEALTDYGYDPLKIHVVPILIGVSGTIYKEHTKQSLTKLGLSEGQVNKCISRLHTLAVKSLHSIVTTRRQMQATLEGPGPAPMRRPYNTYRRRAPS